jgi:hypothetical protein
MKVSRALLVIATLAVAVPVCAQSLGDLAKKEQERRKASAPAAKTYTDDDLKKITPPGGAQAPADPAAKPADGSAKPAAGTSGGDAKPAGDKDDKAAGPKMDEAAWRARMNNAREELRRNEAFHDALQSRINGLTADFSARDDPYQRAQIADDRQKALAELARVTGDIEKGKQAITDIEEEARRAMVPPGWIR